MLKKLDFDQAMERLNEERYISKEDVQARALARTVYLSEWHIPGCLSESRAFSPTKEDAIVSALAFAEDEFGTPPKGMKTALKKEGVFHGHSPVYGTVITTVERMTLADLL